ncbi:MAG: MBOAT family protein [Clostridiales bacterium]|nr:MBOAT family protein [Clostridiales bacterium]
MSLVSALFLVFVAAVLLLYYVLPKSFRFWVVLAASLAFAGFLGFYTLLFVVISAVICYTGGLLSGPAKSNAARNVFAAITVIINIALLCAVKYYNVIGLAAERLNTLFGAVDGQNKFFLYAVPVGMSFYVLQTTGYILDCRWEKIAPEKNFFKVLLFSTYFPQLMSGPVNTYANLSAQFEKAKEVKFSFARICDGAVRVAWGFFKKLVIAERAAMVVNMIYGNHQVFTGWYVPLGVFFFAIQLYTDFSGCMEVVIGVSHMFGIELPENFNCPFFSKTVKEYWRRWHITLGAWLRDYLMYPVLKSTPLIKLGDWSKAKFGKKNGKKVPTYIALLILWFAVGYWHGGLWNYVIGSGILHFIYIVLGMIFEPLFKKIRPKIGADKIWFRIFQSVRTFVLMLTGFVFFRSASVGDAVDMYAAIFRKGGAALNWTNFCVSGMDLANLIVLIVAVLIVFAVDTYKYRPGEDEEPRSAITLLRSKGIVLLWAAFMVLLVATLIFGMYGLGYDSGSFIYARI